MRLGFNLKFGAFAVTYRDLICDWLFVVILSFPAALMVLQFISLTGFLYFELFFPIRLTNPQFFKLKYQLVKNHGS